jgi:hypothetical protein
MPAIPLMVRPDGECGILNSAQVAESRDIPPLPVSSIKLKGWEMVLNFASMRITPPFNCRKGKAVMNFAGFSTTRCWAKSGGIKNTKKR